MRTRTILAGSALVLCVVFSFMAGAGIAADEASAGSDGAAAAVARNRGAPNDAQPASAPVGQRMDIEVLRLKHIPAETAAILLKPAMSGHGMLSFDARTNALVVTDIPEHMQRVLAVVKEVDRSAAAPPPAPPQSDRRARGAHGEYGGYGAPGADGSWGVAVLGAAVSKAPAVLARQLKLPRGAGLVVDQVNEGGPAADAGVQVYDVLHKLDGQLLVNGEQLDVLVGALGPGAEVRLEVYREGKPLKLTGRLIEAAGHGHEQAATE